MIVVRQTRAEEMAQWLRTLVALEGDLGQFPALTRQLTTIYNSSSGDLSSFLVSSDTTHTVHIYTCRQNNQILDKTVK